MYIFQISSFCTLLLWNTVVLKNYSCILRTAHPQGPCSDLQPVSCLVQRPCFCWRDCISPLICHHIKPGEEHVAFKTDKRGCDHDIRRKLLFPDYFQHVCTSLIAGNINSSWSHQNSCWMVEKKYLCLPPDRVQINTEYSTVYLNLLWIYHTAIL